MKKLRIPIGEKTHAARESLPKDLRPVFDQLLSDYKFQTQVIHGSRMFSPRVIAELVRTGWRFVQEN